MQYLSRNSRQLLGRIFLLSLCFVLSEGSLFKTDRPSLDQFLNFGIKQSKLGRNLQNEIIKSKVTVLGDLLKKHVQKLRKAPGQNVELVFLVDSSASVGAENFFNEIKFVKKLLADFTVAYNHTRVAVITFSSRSKVIRHIDHVAHASQRNHKCSLLERELPKIRYSGGGTYTLGALLEAQGVLAISRNDAVKAVFLVTDGYSNGGDPRPAAEFLKSRGVIIFTFGIQNGNVKELYDMASEPKEEHSYILGSFQEFEALARRALHEDLQSDLMLSQNTRECDTLCPEGMDCCDAFADCTCGAHTGVYACTCQKGYYGTGMKGDCKRCPVGTYRDFEGTGDVRTCEPCPDTHMTSEEGSTSPFQCYCRRGYTQSGLACQKLQCPALKAPKNGFFVRGSCEHVVNAACGIRCKPGYKLKGSSIRLCGEDGHWSGKDAKCVMKTCPRLKPPRNGSLTCTAEDRSIDTECHFKCDPGFQLVGSRSRTCLPVAMWDGIRVYCKPIFCRSHPVIKHGFMKPSSCSVGKSKYGSVCEFGCSPGYVLEGALKTACIGKGSWSGDHKSRCVDVDPPIIQCPRNKTVTTDLNENYANAEWERPIAKDKTKGKVLLATIPATRQPMKMKIGLHKIIYFAKDESGNKANCSFFVNVEDKEPPTVDWCESPPTFLSKDNEVDVFWEEPMFSDNSGFVSINRTKEPGKFSQGDTQVQYWASDRSGNLAHCNITIKIQKHACEKPVDPINGATNCTENPEAVYCTLTCVDGYAFAMRPNQDYFCAYDGVWMPHDNPMPFPECSVTTVSNTISQSGEMAMNDESGSVCNDIFFMSQVENKLEQKLEEALAEMCADDILCNVAAVEAVCESILSDMEEEDNSLFTRKKRDTFSKSNQYISENWPNEKSSRWLYWERGTPISLKKNVDMDQPRSRVKRQFGFPSGLFEAEEEDSSITKEREEEKANFLGVLTSLILESLGNDIGMTHFSSFLTNLGTDSESYELEDFMVAFTKEFGQDKTNSVRQLAEQKLGKFLLPPQRKSEHEVMQSDMDLSTFGFQADQQQFPEELPSPQKSSSKKGLKVKFKIEGHGEGPTEKVQQAMHSLLEFADKGHFDIDFGQKQLKVAAIRLSEDPEYLCDPGSVLQGKLCVKCSIGTFFNVVAKECQSCPSGSFQPKEGQVSCLVCPDNTSTKSKNAKSDADCKAMCLPGSFASDTLEPCTTCPRGQYQDEYASMSCNSCPNSTTTWRRGAWISEECQPPCERGYVSENGLIPCLPCPRGTFQTEQAKSSCYVCPGNSDTTGNGTFSLNECTGGSSDMQMAYSQLKTLEINDCFSFPCQNGGTCDALELGYICSCLPGYTGSNCESEIDECLGDPCENSAKCIDKLADFECVCAAGFDGSLCQNNIDECVQMPCINNGTCVDLIDSFKCMCDSGYTGPTCEINIDECEMNPCANSAECVDGVSDYTCKCAVGFTGRECQIQIDTCESSPCIHGSCTTLIGDFSCECAVGYSGKTCDYNVDDCEALPCENGATCHDWINGFSCQCLPGFSGKKCEIEMATDFIMEISSSGVMDYAKVDGFSQNMNQTTVCFWMKTKDTDNYGTPLSYGTDLHDNALTLTDYNGFVLYINGEKRITDVNANDGQWHFICATWKSEQGLWAIYKDAEQSDSGDGLSAGQTISDDGVIVIGQEQDQRGGKFSAPESFVGEIAFLNIWNKALSWKSIKDLYTKCDRYVGNMRAWPDFEVGLMGNIKIKHSPFCRGCGVPVTPENAHIVQSGSEPGKHVKAICNNGYKLYRGDDERTCLIQGHWSGTEPECRAISCGFPRPLYNGDSSATSYVFGGVISYSCSAGHRLSGNAKRTCKADGKWDGQDPTCQVITCSSPKPVDHSVVISSLDSYLPTNKITYSCMKGYQMDGPPFKTCDKGGKWGNGGNCQPLNCGGAPSIQNGKLNAKESLTVAGSSIDVVCSDGFVLKGDTSVKCTTDGTWARPLPKCVLPTCAKPPKVDNGKVKVRASQTKRQAAYKCDEGFVLEGSKTLKCLSSGEWDGPFSKCVVMSCQSPPLPDHGKSPSKQEWNIGETYIPECEAGFSPVDNQELVCEEGYSNGEWVGDDIQCQPIFCESVNRIAGGIFTIIGGKQKSQQSFITFPVTPEFEISRKRRYTNPYYGNNEDLDHSFPAIGDSLDFSDDEEFASPGWPPVSFSGVVSHGTENIGSDNNFAIHTQSTHGSSFNYRQTSQSGGFGEHTQSSHHSSSDNDGQTSQNSGVEFGQTSQNSGFEFGQTSQNSGFEYGQTSQNSGFDLGQSSQNSGFDYGQTSQNSGFDYGQTSQNSGFDYGQTSQNSGFDDGQTSQNNGFDQGQSSQTSEFDYSQTSQNSGFDDYEQISQDSGFDLGQISQTSGSFEDQKEQVEQNFNEFEKGSSKGSYLNEKQPYNTVVEYQCRPGYKLIGSKQRRCSQNAMWDAPEPRCYELYCPEIHPVENGALIYFGSGVNSNVEFQCNKGFHLEGDVERVCQSSRTWTGETPVCSNINCGIPKDLPNGTVEYTSTVFESAAVYDCFQGYVLEGSFERYCDSSGFWNGSLPRCIPVACDVPPVIKNGYITFEGSLYAGSPVEYTCEECYSLVGTELRTCQVDGTWSLEEPKCELIYCKQIPSDIDYGEIIGGDNSCGSLSRVECDPGYKLKGKKQSSCRETGKWHGWHKKFPVCLKKSCGKPSMLKNGKLIGDSYEFEDAVEYECNEGYVFKGEQSIVCREDGSWSKANPSCDLVLCKKPQGPSNGKVRLSGLFYKSYAKIICDRGFQIDGPDHLECQSTGKWDKEMPFCLPIICPAAETPDNSHYNSTEVYFESFTNLKYECDTGYYSIEDNTTMTCSEYGNWTGNLIDCSPVDCGNPGVLSNGLMVPGQHIATFTYQSNFTAECDEGYNLVGHHVITCLDTAEWSDQITCNRIVCGTPEEIENGQAVFEDPHAYFGAIIHFKCNRGYILQGSPDINCLESSEWSAEFPTCQPVTCPEPRETFGAKIIGNVYEFGRKIGYSCENGYNLKGESELTCLHDGTWSNSFPVCDLILCKPPKELPYGKYVSLNITSMPIKTEPQQGILSSKKTSKSRKSSKVAKLLEQQSESLMFRLGEQIELKCNIGYLKSTYGISKCTEDGWSPLPADCYLLNCPDPIQIRNGVVHGDQFTYGSLLNYTCNEGYELFGPESRRCLINEDWSDDEPYCRPVECPLPAKLINGNTKGKGFKYQSMISYTCDHGFKLQGETFRVCQSTGYWTGEMPVCTEIFCDSPQKVPHSILDLTDLKVGGKAQYSCMEGYKLEGSSTLKCLNEGIWNKKSPVCNQIDCGSPNVDKRVVITGNLTVYDAKITYNCQRGYEVVGNKHATCLHNGQWSSESPACDKVLCPTPRIPTHGYIVPDKKSAQKVEENSALLNSQKTKGNNKSKGTKGRPTKLTEPLYGVDDEIQFSCESGWRVAGKATTRCTQLGVWSDDPPVCKRILCKDPPARPHVKYHGDDYLYGSTLNVTCHTGFIIKGTNILTCNENSEWEGDVKTCDPVDCGPPIQTSRMVLSYQHSSYGEFKLGSKVSYGCEEGYEIVGAQEMTCAESGNWTGYEKMPICEEKTCGAPSFVGNASFTEENLYRQTATYICNRGYSLIGQDSTVCALGKWEALNITCLPVDCYKLVVPKFGKITAHHFTYGSVANYTCVEGYRLEGNPTVLCDADALWKGELPTCIKVDCGKPEKQENGRLKFSKTDYGSISKYSCNEGYELKGNRTRTCLGTGKWSGHVAQCHRVSCLEPSPPKYGFTIGVNYLFGDKVRFTCSEGYALKGAEFVECMNTGLWSDTLPTCEGVECGPPPFLVNGRRPAISNDSYIFMDKAEYGCEKGFIARGDMTSICNKKGVWSDIRGRCSRIACGRPTINTDGAIIIGRSYLYKDRVRVGCPPGSKPNGTSLLMCQGDGSWSGDASCIVGCSRKCLNGGVCMHKNKCSCPSGYVGKNCQRPICAQPCLNGGSCIAPYKCKCSDSFTGPRCQTPICRSGCGGSGRCIGPNVCLCKYGDIGRTCKDPSDYDLQQEATLFSDWDIAALRGGNHYRRRP